MSAIYPSDAESSEVESCSQAGGSDSDEALASAFCHACSTGLQLHLATVNIKETGHATDRQGVLRTLCPSIVTVALQSSILYIDLSMAAIKGVHWIHVFRCYLHNHYIA